ncbi:MAG: Nif3-like dinuclear metal center hexameric protein [Coriobacteriaceae bacterium]|nr:Nif3-like dinuclear metal center hexameric protein [Coriobacteriaceae bacterium]
MTYRVADIEQLLYRAFPAADALPDDRHGLLVGDPLAEVSGIGIALDATISLIRQAHDHHCNVLVTHHPVFWHAPDSFLAAASPGLSSGAAVFLAARLGVALIAMHTNVDCSPRTAEMLLTSVGFNYLAPLQPLRELKPQSSSDAESQSAGNPIVSLGQLGVSAEGKALTLDELASRYRQAFGQVARVWGEKGKLISKVATCSGSGGDLLANVLNSDADCYVTGELRYHEALALTEAGVALIELGHDISELPYRDYLQSALLQAGFPAERMMVVGPAASWW